VKLITSLIAALIPLGMGAFLVLLGLANNQSGPAYCGLLIIAGVLLLLWILHGEPRMLDALRNKD
jgi:hypothetical protein